MVPRMWVKVNKIMIFLLSFSAGAPALLSFRRVHHASPDDVWRLSFTDCLALYMATGCSIRADCPCLRCARVNYPFRRREWRTLKNGTSCAAFVNFSAERRRNENTKKSKKKDNGSNNLNPQRGQLKHSLCVCLMPALFIIKKSEFHSIRQLISFHTYHERNTTANRG